MLPIAPTNLSRIFALLELAEPCPTTIDTPLCGLATIDEAGPGHISFWTKPDLSGRLRTCHGAVILVPENFAIDDAKFVRVASPYRSMIRLIEELHVTQTLVGLRRVAPTATVHATAVVEGIVGEQCKIGPHVVIDATAVVGDGCRLDAGVVIGPSVHMGRECHLHPGVVVGSRGFGFVSDSHGTLAVPHYAGVIIGDRVELGANTVVAAGFLRATHIGDDTACDALVQIGHNCSVGNFVRMAAQSGLAGDVTVEDGVHMGGGAQVSNGLRLGAQSRIAAKAGVTKDLAAGETYAGFPAEPIASWRKATVLWRRLAKQ